jgi:hypothetical protein
VISVSMWDERLGGGQMTWISWINVLDKRRRHVGRTEGGQREGYTDGRRCSPMKCPCDASCPALRCPLRDPKNTMKTATHA